MEFVAIGYCLHRLYNDQRWQHAPQITPDSPVKPSIFEEVDEKKEHLRLVTLFNIALSVAQIERSYEDKNWAILLDNSYFFECPHCQGGVQVLQNQVACKIFRHGTYKQPDNPQIPPHLPKDQCDELVRTGQINGCGKPFLFVFAPDGRNYVEKCGYI